MPIPIDPKAKPIDNHGLSPRDAFDELFKPPEDPVETKAVYDPGDAFAFGGAESWTWPSPSDYCVVETHCFPDGKAHYQNLTRRSDGAVICTYDGATFNFGRPDCDLTAETIDQIKAILTQARGLFEAEQAKRQAAYVDRPNPLLKVEEKLNWNRQRGRWEFLCGCWLQPNGDRHCCGLTGHVDALHQLCKATECDPPDWLKAAQAHHPTQFSRSVPDRTLARPTHPQTCTCPQCQPDLYYRSWFDSFSKFPRYHGVLIRTVDEI